MSDKECFKCKRVLAISEFYKHPRMADGHLNKCKECTKRDVREWHASTRPARHAYERRRYQEPERRASVATHAKATRARHPEKYRARTAVSNAVRDGRLCRKPCEQCGADKAQAHHHDYSKPLDVEWLCFRCHMAEHGKVAL